MPRATEILHSELVSAVVRMSGEVSRPKAVRYALDDAARKRPFRPLGRYPEIAEECARAGAEFHDVARPLQVMLAHLRRRYGQRIGCLSEALERAEREESQAEVEETRLSLSVKCPEPHVLASYIREKREQLIAEEAAVEIAESLLYAREAR